MRSNDSRPGIGIEHGVPKEKMCPVPRSSVAPRVGPLRQEEGLQTAGFGETDAVLARQTTGVAHFVGVSFRDGLRNGRPHQVAKSNLTARRRFEDRAFQRCDSSTPAVLPTGVTECNVGVFQCRLHVAPGQADPTENLVTKYGTVARSDLAVGLERGFGLSFSAFKFLCQEQRKGQP